MTRWAGAVAMLTLGALAVGCSGNGATDGANGGAVPAGTAPSSTSTADPGPATLDNPLGTGTLDPGTEGMDGLDTSALAVRDAIFLAIHDAGAVRGNVTGGPFEVTIDLEPALEPWNTGARRFTWHERGTDREQLQLASGRVCVNLAAGRALRKLGSSTFGRVVPSRLPYSCTVPGSSVGNFVVYGMAALDPLTRLGKLMGRTQLTDLGLETEPDGAQVRHVRIEGTEAGVASPSTPEVPVSYDLWVDGSLRPIRAAFTSPDEVSTPYAVTFTYGDVASIRLPADSERGQLTFRPGDGHVGSYHGPVTPAPDVSTGQ